MKSLGLNRLDQGLLKYLEEVIHSGQWCRHYDKEGVYRKGMVQRFEEWAASFFGRKHALAVTSATQALQLALMGIDVKGKEVIVPAYSFTACPIAILNAGATPVVAPVDETLALDAEAVEALITDQTAAIMVVHMRGLATNMKRLHEIATRRGIKILEDCSEFDGLTYEGKPAGSSYSDVAVFSFQAKKIMSSGEGGLLITDDPAIIQKAHRLHDPAWFMRQGVPPEDALEDMEFSGGCRMNEITGAVLFYQTQNFATFLEKVRQNQQQLKRQVQGAAKVVPATNGSETGGTLALLAPDQSTAVRWCEQLKKSGGQVYQESAKPQDVHYYAGWPPALRNRCAVRLSLAQSEELIAKTVLLQIDPDWSEADLQSWGHRIVAILKGEV